MIVYSVNGLYFEELGIYVDSSSGFGGLKRKQPEVYEFPDQNGDSLDLANPYFQSRVLTLKCWIKGDSWDIMYDNFNKFMAEFKKPETQRLLIEYPPAKTRIYQVICLDDVELKSRIKKGKVFGTFEIKLTEPNPIKKVFFGFGNYNAILRYTSPEETEIFLPNSVKIEAHSNVDIVLNLTSDNVVSNYNYYGRNMIRNSNEISATGNNPTEIISSIPVYKGKYYLRYENFAAVGGSVNQITVEFRPTTVGLSPVFITLNVSNLHKNLELNLIDNTIYRVFIYNRKVGSSYDPNINVILKQVSLTKEKIDFWTISPNDIKYIVVAGNISKLQNVYFNGSILWKEL